MIPIRTRLRYQIQQRTFQIAAAALRLHFRLLPDPDAQSSAAQYFSGLVLALDPHQQWSDWLRVANLSEQFGLHRDNSISDLLEALEKQPQSDLTETRSYPNF